jgi:hypothetical protein
MKQKHISNDFFNEFFWPIQHKRGFIIFVYINKNVIRIL